MPRFQTLYTDFTSVAISPRTEVRRCTLREDVRVHVDSIWSSIVTDYIGRFIDCEKWRAEFGPKGLDDLVQNFKYVEKAEVFKYYPQYYHKTDKVRQLEIFLKIDY